MAPPRLTGLTKLTLETAPSVCHECVWWQSRGSRARSTRTAGWSGSRTSSARSGRSTTATTGVSLGVDRSTGRRRSSRMRTSCPAGPPSDDAMLVTCAYLVDESSAVGAPVALPGRDRRGARPRRVVDRGVRLPLPEGESAHERASACTGRSSRPTSSATSASASCARPGASGWRGSSSAGSRRSRRASARGCCGW